MQAVMSIRVGSKDPLLGVWPLASRVIAYSDSRATMARFGESPMS